MRTHEMRAGAREQHRYRRPERQPWRDEEDPGQPPEGQPEQVETGQKVLEPLQTDEVAERKVSSVLRDGVDRSFPHLCAGLPARGSHRTVRVLQRGHPVGRFAESVTSTWKTEPLEKQDRHQLQGKQKVWGRKSWSPAQPSSRGYSQDSMGF